MQPYQTEAILLTTRDWSSADRMATLLSREYGKITAIAYGARRARNSLSGCVQPFMHLDLVLTPGNTIDCIKQAEIRNSFRPLRENLDYMVFGTLIAELIQEICPERQPEPEIFALLLASLAQISQRNPRLVASACLWQILAFSGFRPQYTHCVACGAVLTFPAFFDSKLGGGVCSQACASSAAVPFSEAACSFLDNLLRVSMEEPQSFTVSGSALLETEKILTDYLLYCLEKPLKSMSFIKQLANLG